MKGFQEFMLKPERLRTRSSKTSSGRATRIYGPLSPALARPVDARRARRREATTQAQRVRPTASRAHAGLATIVLLAPACLLFSVFVLYPIAAQHLALALRLGRRRRRRSGSASATIASSRPTPSSARRSPTTFAGSRCYLIAPILGLALAIFLQPGRSPACGLCDRCSSCRS